MNVIEKLIDLPDEPIISDENEDILQKITSITRTAQFKELNLTEEKLDELVECVEEQEGFAGVVESIISSLERAPSIRIEEEIDEIDFI